MMEDGGADDCCECHLCESTLTAYNRCNAHILPRSFYKHFYPEDFGSTIYSTDAAMENIRKAPIGIYDDSILCQACDNKLGLYDDYFLKFIKKYQNNMARLPSCSKPTWVIYGFDQRKLKTFILSFAFRAAISTRHEFETFRLKGVDYDKVKGILNGTEKSSKYTIFCIKYSKADVGLALVPKRIPSSKGKKTQYIVPLPNNLAFIIIPRSMKQQKNGKVNGALCSHKKGFLMGEAAEDYYESKYFLQEVEPRLTQLIDVNKAV